MLQRVSGTALNLLMSLLFCAGAVVAVTTAHGANGQPGPPDAPSSQTAQEQAAEAQAQMVVYLLDASGTMEDKIDLLKSELRKSIGALQPVQAFNVIFFVDGQSTTAFNPDRLVLASLQNKREAYGFIDAVSISRHKPDLIPAIRTAFAQKAELIYLLTDKHFNNHEETLQEIRRLNDDRSVRINTIAFLEPGDEYQAWLRQVAQENGGRFRFVSREDLNAGEPADAD